jgi:hypothetical protein
MLNGGILAGTFHAAVPAIVGIAAIPVKLLIKPVVLMVVGNQVVEGKAVMAGDKVNAAVGFAVGLRITSGPPSSRSASLGTMAGSPLRNWRT